MVPGAVPGMSETPVRKPSELCEKCKGIYESWNDLDPKTARALKRQIGSNSLTDFIRNQTLAVRESCTANNH